MTQSTLLGRDDDRFELRAYDFSCVPKLYEAALESRPEISPWMAWLHAAYSLRDAEKWVAHSIAAWEAGAEYHFVIYDRTDGAVTGCCGLNDWRKKDMICNLGYWTRTSKSRLGAATQAARLLSEFGLKSLGMSRVELVAAEGNHASRRVAEKAGAIYEGLQRKRVKVGDKIHDGHMYVFV